MKPEISKSFSQIPTRDAADRKAEEILNWFMAQLGPLRKVLWTDIDAAYEGDPAAASYEEIIVVVSGSGSDRDPAHGASLI